MCGTYMAWLWLDVFLVLLNGDVLVGVVAFDSVCVWQVWLCVKSGQVSCCSFGHEIQSRCGFQCQGLRWCVFREFQVAVWRERHNCITSGWDGTERLLLLMFSYKKVCCNCRNYVSTCLGWHVWQHATYHSSKWCLFISEIWLYGLEVEWSVQLLSPSAEFL